MPVKYSLTIRIITWSLRIICGGLFIFSGFVKAVDPWGTIFKVEDYLAAFGMAIPFALLRLFVFGLCAVEFIVGCFLFMGCFRKSCPVFAALIMVFMLPLTLWVAIENPVAECGCFGDALQISNWLTFWKNILLSVGIAWLVRYNLSGICMISPAFQWLAVVASGLFILIVELIGFIYQPLIDFRGYPIGSHLFADYEDENDEGLDVFDIDTADDKNDEALDPDGKELVVMIPKVSMVSPATTWKLNSLYEWAQDNDVKMIGVVSGSTEEIKEWEDLSMATYPLYLADDTAIKEVVRGNPGIVYLDHGKIEWKATLGSINIDDFLSPEVSGDASTFGRDNAQILLNCVLSYLIVIFFLIFISFTPRMAHLLVKGGLASKRGVKHH
ncbi:MAG: DoxX family membrane protein [Muribaculaceae bacterium]|nr:DoxX family membrane protein [Muribaculaceae bacterium]